MAGINIGIRALTRPDTARRARIAGLETKMRSLLKVEAQQLRDDMKEYPGQVPGTQRQAKKGVRGDGTRKPYERTYKLREGWHADDPVTTGGALVARVYNDAVDTNRKTPKKYASYVEGPVQGENRQVRFHGAHGWKNIDVEHKKRGQELAVKVRSALREAEVFGAV